MNRTQAIADIGAVFGAYKSLLPSDHAWIGSRSNEKLYELFVLSELIDELANRGFSVSFVGSTLKFKAAPGKIKTSDPHFGVTAPDGSQLWVFVDIEFRTLGCTHSSVSDKSGLHELDIVVVNATPDYPQHDQILMAVECKSGAFAKKLLKEALGVRRELSYLKDPQPSALTMLGGLHVSVAAEPPSEFWVAYLDPVGSDYSDSPAAFSIELRKIEP